MTSFRFLAGAFTILLSGAAVGQEATAPAAAPAVATPAMPNDCRAPAARHDHGAEKGTPTPKMTGCPMEMPTGAATKAKPKSKPAHDHARVHKLM